MTCISIGLWIEIPWLNNDSIDFVFFFWRYCQVPFHSNFQTGCSIPPDLASSFAFSLLLICAPYVCLACFYFLCFLFTLNVFDFGVSMHKNIRYTAIYIHGSWFGRRRSWVRFLWWPIPVDFFLSGYLLCGSRCMLSYLIITLWRGKLFLLSYSIIRFAFVSSNWSPVCLLVLVLDAWSHFLLNWRVIIIPG